MSGISNQKRWLSIVVGAAAASPVAAQAGLVTIEGSPVQETLFPGGTVLGGSTPTFNNSAWDVDGAFGPEFNLVRLSSGTSSVGPYSRTIAGPAGIVLRSATNYGNPVPYNGMGIVADADGIAALSGGFVVGPTLAPYSFATQNNVYPINDGAVVGYLSEYVRSYAGTTSPYRRLTSTGELGGQMPSVNGFGVGDHAIGFQFDAGGATHYGWATVRLEFGAVGGPHQVTIVDWTYNDTPNAPVTVGERQVQVSEPAPVAGLAALALGAAGVRAWRRRRTETGGRLSEH